MGDVATAVVAVAAPAIAAEADAAPTAAVAVVIDVAMVSGAAPAPIKPPDIPRAEGYRLHGCGLPWIAVDPCA